jgi:hypothetical protein
MTNAGYPQTNSGFYEQKLQRVDYRSVQDNPEILQAFWDDQDGDINLERNQFSRNDENNKLCKYRLGVRFNDSRGEDFNMYYYSLPFTFHGRIDSLSAITNPRYAVNEYCPALTYHDKDYGYYTVNLACDNPNTGVTPSYWTYMRLMTNNGFTQDIRGQQSDCINPLGWKLGFYADNNPNYTPVDNVIPVRFDTVDIYGKVVFTGETKNIVLDLSGHTPTGITKATNLSVSGITNNNCILSWQNHLSGSSYINWHISGGTDHSSNNGDDFGWFDNQSGKAILPTSINTNDQLCVMQPDTDYKLWVVYFKCGLKVYSDAILVHTTT